MHSFQPSRGKTLFEVFLALGMAGSLAGAWLQTGAMALLGAAGIASLYALVHLFDMRRPKPAATIGPQRIDFDTEIEREAVTHQDQPVRPSADDQPPAVGTAADEAVPAAKGSVGPKAKAPRKRAARRAKAPKAAKPAAPEEVDVPRSTAPEDPKLVEPAFAEEEFVFAGDDEAAHSHIAPLFEPEPFVRMPRRAFGRRGRI